MTEQTTEQVTEPTEAQQEQESSQAPAASASSEYERKLKRLAERATELGAVYEERKKEAKIAKDAYEAAMEDLRKEALGSEPAPLFEGDGDDQVNSNAWRDVSVTELIDHGMPQSSAVKLTENGIATLGNLSDHQNEHSGEIDIRGFGEAKTEAVNNAMQAWFAANPTSCPKVESEQGDDTEDTDGWEDAPEQENTEALAASH